MTSSRSPLDAALDVVLYAPLGLALSAGEEVPRLAAKGRAQLTARLATARVVGEFAVRQGSRQVLRLAEQAGLGVPARSAPGSTGPLEPDAGPRTAPTGPSGPGAGPEGRRRGRASRAARPGPRGPASPPAPVAASAPAGAVPDAGGLAIPGYDSLSASQVVPRLAGLSAAELGAVEAYELAHRRRRTILARISQLRAG